MKRWSPLLLSLLLAACSGGPAATEAASPTTTSVPTGSVAGASGSHDKTKEGKFGSKGGGEGKTDPGGSGSATGDDGGNGDGPGGGSGSGPSSGGADRGDDPGEGNGGDGGPVAGHSPRRASFPDAGTFTYAQSGYREFCTASCEREPLPARQDVVQTVRSQGDDAVVITEQNSDDSTIRATTRYRDGMGAVEEVYTRLKYEAFEYEKTYRPNPPVVTVPTDLSVGRTWKGSWQGDVSGDYKGAVVSRETVSVGGRNIDALKIFSVTNFHGEFEGRSDLVAWLDPSTLAVLRSKANVHLKSSFGTYNTKFDTKLLEGPGY
jgi:hypothetical protein